MLLRIAPLLFVLLWSTGFIASKVGAPHAEPFTFLAIRFALVLAILIPIVLLFRFPLPDRRSALNATLTGILIHTAYLAGVLWALRLDMPAGVVALIVATQPVLTAIVAGPLLGEGITGRHWVGLVLGFAGVVLVLSPKIVGLGSSEGLTALTVLAASAGLLGITLGTLNQKLNGAAGDLVSLTMFQYIGALAVAFVGALTFETMQVEWTIDFLAALAWLVIVLSLGAIGLLMLLIRASAVSRVTSLFYLVPATTSVMAWAYFGEEMMMLQMAGVILTMLAVIVISRRNS